MKANLAIAAGIGAVKVSSIDASGGATISIMMKASASVSAMTAVSVKTALEAAIKADVSMKAVLDLSAKIEVKGNIIFLLQSAEIFLNFSRWGLWK